MDYLLHLAKDKKFAILLKAAAPYRIKHRENVFVYLCASIMSQQLSVRVADVIYDRFLKLYGAHDPTPQQVLDTDSVVLRGIGLSNNKASYIRNVAAFAIDPGMDFTKLSAMENEELISYLTQIKGVGRWTVEMLLMSALGREDVFAVDDLGIQQAMIRLYRLDVSDKKLLREKMLKISGKWSPYRTYACRHLWSWKDNSPLKEKALKSKEDSSAKDKKAKLLPKSILKTKTKTKPKPSSRETVKAKPLSKKIGRGKEKALREASSEVNASATKRSKQKVSANAKKRGSHR